MERTSRLYLETELGLQLHVVGKKHSHAPDVFVRRQISSVLQIEAAIQVVQHEVIHQVEPGTSTTGGTVAE